MSAALGAPTFVPSHKRSSKPVIQYKSQRWPNAVLEFSYKGANPRDPSVEYYRCISCYKHSKQASGEKCPVAHLTLRNGVMATDPDHPATPHSCSPNEDADSASVLSRRFMYEVSTEVRRSRKRPREAFDEAVSSVHERFHEYEDDVQRGIQANLNSGYGFASKRRALSRNRHHNSLKGNIIDAILPELRITKDSSTFLQLECKTEGRRLLLFYADKDLEALVNVDYILGDGNFKYNPTEFHNPGQLYTLHVVVKGEAHPVVYALMQSFDVQAYEVLFGALKASIVNKYGHAGTLATSTTWLFDYESAAIQAVNNTFQTSMGPPKVRILHQLFRVQSSI